MPPTSTPSRSTLAAVFAAFVLAGCEAAPEAPALDLWGFSPASAARQSEVEARILGAPSASRMRETHRRLTREPVHAGTEASEEAAELIADRLRDYGFDSVHVARYEVPLPRPVEQSVEMVAPRELLLELREPPLPDDPDTGRDGVLPPFNAYSPDGDVTADVVYVNYGMPGDYRVLDSLGIPVAGRIVLARYGNGWRGIKARTAAERGAVGALLYSDPQDYQALGGARPGDFEPVDEMVQRGSVLDIPRYPGDPQTPGHPSTGSAERIPLDQASTIPRIPVQPLSWNDAQLILGALDGPAAPPSWRSGAEGYDRLGPGPARVRMRLRFDRQLRTIVNVIGVMRGSEEPERVVMAGGHRDAWTFGGRDPMSGAASLLETARVIGEAARAGYPPRRSIAIASWDAEEYGLLGSTEFGEEQADALMANLVTYVNRESYTAGPFFAGGSHALEPLVNAVTVRVDAPGEAGRSVWDAWHAEASDEDRGEGSGSGSEPRVHIGALGSGSDYTVFLDHLGVPSLNLGFSGGSGMYHSRYDTHRFFVNVGDPDFVHGARLAEIVALLLTRLANADVLPFDYRVTAAAVERYLDEIAAEAEGRGMPLDLTDVRTENGRLWSAGQSLADELPRIFRLSPQQLAAFSGILREVNGQLMSVERGFLRAEGLPGRPFYRHQLYAPGLDTGYGAKTLPGIREAVERDDAEEAARMAEALAATLEEATSRLRRAVLFARGILPRPP